MAHELKRGDRPVVLQSRHRRLLLAQTIAGHRMYAPGTDLLGLGPLLGIRGAVDGLDEVVPGIEPDVAPDEIRLTIDPELQAKLWTTLKQGASEFSTDPARAAFTATRPYQTELAALRSKMDFAEFVEHRVLTMTPTERLQFDALMRWNVRAKP